MTDIKAALNFQDIKSCLIPHTLQGRNLMQEYEGSAYRKADTLKEDYRRIEYLMLLEKDNKTASLHDALSHILTPNIKKLESGAELSLHEIFELKQFVYFYLKTDNFRKKHSLLTRDEFPQLQELFDFLDPGKQNSPTFHLSPDFSTNLGKAMEALKKASLKLKHAEQQHLEDAKKACGIHGLKPEIVVSRLQQKQVESLRATEYYTISIENSANITFKLKDSPAMQDLKQQIAQYTKDLKDAEAEALEHINRNLILYKAAILKAVNVSAALDWDLCRAAFGIRFDCCIPKISACGAIKIKAARNLHLQRYFEQSGRCLQSIDFDLNPAVNVLIGPNMGGKTTALKTLGQMAIMLQMGIPLPCEQAELPLFDFVWYNQDSGADAEDLSSFGRELISFGQALDTSGVGLILLDEFAKGTNPTEGNAIATATLMHLMHSPHCTFAATHYSAPAMLTGVGRYSIRGFHEEVFASLEVKRDLKHRLSALAEAMDYNIVKLEQGQVPPMCAMSIAEALGMHPDILQKAREILNT